MIINGPDQNLPHDITQAAWHRNRMEGCDAIVVGCGPSASALDQSVYTTHWTIGCNRMIPRCSPDFALCFESHRDIIWTEPGIAKHGAMFMFTHRAIDGPRAKQPLPVRAVNLTNKDVRSWFIEPGTPQDGDRLALGQSPFFAAALAVFLGFRTVGIIGVDLTGDRWGDDIGTEEKAWRRLRELAESMGSRLVNLSTCSRLQAIERGTLDELRSKHAVTNRAIYSECYTKEHYKMGPARFGVMVDHVKQARKLGAKTLLDVGCGRGEVIKWANTAGMMAQGVEIVPDLCGEHVQQIESLTDLSFADESFDIVMCSDVLEHINPDDTMAALRELVRVARQTLIIHVAWFPTVHEVCGTKIDLHCNKRTDWRELLEGLADWSSVEYSEHYSKSVADIILTKEPVCQT